MHRKIVRPFGSSIPASRGLSMLLALAVLWVTYQTVREPATWRWLAMPNDDSMAAQVAIGSAEAQVAAEEVVVPGPNDLDPAAMAEFQSREELITDRTELRPREMIAYWQLMAWSRTQSFEEFEKRAGKEPAFTQLWDQPGLYRAKPVRLKMHVRRVLQYDAPENPLGLKVAYEAWGWTDESKSFPYTVVFADKPDALPVGSDIEGEVVFVGYFLKNMAYTAFDKRRAAPLMVGRVRMTGSAAATVNHSGNRWEVWGIILFAVIIGLVVSVRFFAGTRRPGRTSVLPNEVSGFGFTASDQVPVVHTSESSPLLISAFPSLTSANSDHELDSRLPAGFFGDTEPGVPVR
mgnify:CR=1 FL=1